MVMVFTVAAQPQKYTAANTHSHNDYEQSVPFWTAYNADFGSIEADIFLENGELFIAHDTTGLKAHRTLEEYYIRPCVSLVEKNQGSVFADAIHHLLFGFDDQMESAQASGMSLTDSGDRTDLRADDLTLSPNVIQ